MFKSIIKTVCNNITVRYIVIIYQYTFENVYYVIHKAIKQTYNIIGILYIIPVDDIYRSFKVGNIYNFSNLFD